MIAWIIAMYMTFHSDRQHFSTQLRNAVGSTLVIYKKVAKPSAEFDLTQTEFENLIDLLSQRDNPIIQSANAITEAEFQHTLQQFVDRFSAVEAKELAELGLSPDSPAGQAAMANAKRQVDFVKGVQAQPIEEMRKLISLIRIEVLINGYMLYFGNVEHEVMGMVCFMSRDFQRPTQEDLRKSGLVEMDMSNASEGVQNSPAANLAGNVSASVASRAPTGATLH